jgi:hypothetical protein
MRLVGRLIICCAVLVLLASGVMANIDINYKYDSKTLVNAPESLQYGNMITVNVVVSNATASPDKIRIKFEDKKAFATINLDEILPKQKTDVSEKFWATINATEDTAKLTILCGYYHPKGDELVVHIMNDDKEYDSFEFPVNGRWAVTAGVGALCLNFKDTDKEGDKHNRAPVVPATMVNMFRVTTKDHTIGLTFGFVTGDHSGLYFGPSYILGNDMRLVASVGLSYGEVTKKDGSKDWQGSRGLCYSLSYVVAKF